MVDDSRTSQSRGGDAGAEIAAPNDLFPSRLNPSRAQLVHRLTGEWDGLAEELSGEKLLMKQKELALRAVGELGAGPELLEFLDYLTERGAGDVRE